MTHLDIAKSLKNAHFKSQTTPEGDNNQIIQKTWVSQRGQDFYYMLAAGVAVADALVT